MSVHVIDGLELDVDRGPNWLFVKLRSRAGSPVDVPQVADRLWSIASRHFIYRVVLELDDLATLPEGLMGQLVLLQERLAQCGGALRICGLSRECEDALHDDQMDSSLTIHASRAEAVMGSGEYATISRMV